MTNSLLLTIAQLQVSALDYSGLNPKAAYTVYKFRRALDKALADFEALRDEIVTKTLAKEELEKAVVLEGEGKQESEEYKSIIAKVNPIIKEALNDEVPFPQSFLTAEDYFKLKNANPKILTNYADELLEGVLWKEN